MMTTCDRSRHLAN